MKNEKPKKPSAPKSDKSAKSPKPDKRGVKIKTNIRAGAYAID